MTIRSARSMTAAACVGFAAATTTGVAQLLTPSVFSIESDVELDFPLDAEFTPDGSRFLVTGYDSRNVVVYDAATDALLDDVPVSGRASGIAIDPAGTTAYVALFDQNALSVVDLVSGTEVEVIPLPTVRQPLAVKVMPIGDVVVVTGAQVGDAAVIDTSTRTVLRTFDELRPISNGATPSNQTWSFFWNSFEVLDADRVVNAAIQLRPAPPPASGNVAEPEIQIANVRTGVVTRLRTDPFAGNAPLDAPIDVAVSADGSTIVASNGLSSTGGKLWVIDPASETIVGRVTDGSNVFSGGRVVVSTDGSRAAVSDGNTVLIFDVATGARLFTVNTSALGAVNDLLALDGGQRVLAALGSGAAVIDFATGSATFNTLDAEFVLGATSPVGSRGVVFGQSRGEVFASIDAGSVATPSDVGLLGGAPEADGLTWVAVSRDGSTAAATFSATDTVAIIDIPAQTVTDFVGVGDRPERAVFSPDGDVLIVPNEDSSFVSVVDLSVGPPVVVDVSLAVNGTTGFGAHSAVVSPDGLFAYVHSTDTPDQLYKVDLTSLTTVASLQTGNSTVVTNTNTRVNNFVELSPDGRWLAVPASEDDFTLLVDTFNFSFAGAQFLFDGFGPHEAAFSPDSTKLAIANEADDTVSVFDVSVVPAAAGGFRSVGGQNLFPDQATTSSPRQVEWLSDTEFLVLNRSPEAIPGTSSTPGQQNFSVDLIDASDIGSPTLSNISVRFTGLPGFRPTELVVDRAQRRFLLSNSRLSFSTGGMNPIGFNKAGSVRSYDADSGSLLQEFPQSDSRATHGVASGDGSRAVFAGATGDTLITFALGCIADLNDDGDANANDVGLFVAALGSQDPISDFASPAGVFDAIDLIGFLRAADQPPCQ